MDKLMVRSIAPKDAYPFLLTIHYAKRIPSISFAFGLFDGCDLIGVITYGTPPSSTLRSGIAGAENSGSVLELNRLCLLNNKKNEASFLVARSLRMLPSGKIIISFADTEQGHVGYVYQASNFGYYGLSAKRTDWKVKGKEHLHGQTIADEFRGVADRVKAMRDKYGDDFYLKPRSRKHRYIYITGKQKHKIITLIKYKKLPYPKSSPLNDKC
jgi:hypothetical protein